MCINHVANKLTVSREIFCNVCNIERNSTVCDWYAAILLINYYLCLATVKEVFLTETIKLQCYCKDVLPSETIFKAEGNLNDKSLRVVGLKSLWVHLCCLIRYDVLKE